MRNKAYESIGKAVEASQMLEMTLHLLYEFYHLAYVSNFERKPKDINDPKFYKDPIVNLIKRLSEKQDIDSDFESQMLDYIEDRHLLIHRWAYVKGLPNTESAWLEYKLHADKVDAEARAIVYKLSDYFIKMHEAEYAGDGYVVYLEKVKNIFNSMKK